MSTTLGSMPASGTTENGVLEVAFTSGSQEGTATITAEASNGVSTTTTIAISESQPGQLTLEVSPQTLAPEEESSTVTATAVDPWGNPVAGQTVRIGVEGDGVLGAVGGSEVITRTTNASGQVTATFTRGAVSGVAGVRAELLRPDGSGGYEVIYENRKEIILGAHMNYVPIMTRP